MHIALFGGVFDPPHLGHLKVAQTLLHDSEVDELWFVPVGTHPFVKKQKRWVSDQDCLAMIEQILEPGMKLDRYELEQAGKSYTYQTLQHHKKKYQEHTFSWIIGSDNLANFHLWKDYQKILAEFQVFVYPRDGFSFSPWYKNMVEVKTDAPVDISSTQIRHELKLGNSIHGLVPKSTEEYIFKNNLYQN